MIEEILSRIDSERTLSMCFQRWNDSDYFYELCEEVEGEVNITREKYDELFSVNKKVTRKELEIWLIFFTQHPRIECSKGKDPINYDIHIWNGILYISYNAQFKKMRVSKLSWIQRIFKSIVTLEKACRK